MQNDRSQRTSERVRDRCCYITVDSATAAFHNNPILLLQAFPSPENQYYSENDKNITFLLHKSFILEQLLNKIIK
jgi:hypothetical protein